MKTTMAYPGGPTGEGGIVLPKESAGRQISATQLTGRSCDYQPARNYCVAGIPPTL